MHIYSLLEKCPKGTYICPYCKYFYYLYMSLLPDFRDRYIICPIFSLEKFTIGTDICFSMHKKVTDNYLFRAFF